MEQRAKTDLIVLSVVSILALGLEVLLTRIFAVVLFASHSFMAISLTLLGTGIGATIAYLTKPVSFDKQPARQLLSLAALMLSMLLAFYLLLDTEFVPAVLSDPDSGADMKYLSWNKRFTMVMKDSSVLSLPLLYRTIAIVLIPFVLAGYLQAFIFRHAPKSFALYYGIDLVAATAGAIGIPLLLYPLGLKGTIVVVVLLPLVAMLWIFFGQGLKRSWPALVMLGLVFSGLAYCLVNDSFKVRHIAGFQERRFIKEYWSPMARVGLMEYYRDRELYVIDGASRTFYAPNQDKHIERYKVSLYNMPFHLKAGGKALILASGGGQEVLMAKHHGLKEIDAVEVAQPIVQDILERRKNDPDNPYLLDGVSFEAADGRSYLMRSKKIYDMIEMKEINFHSLASQVAQAWSPYYLFTQEAFAEYMEHLEDDGYLVYSTFSRKPALTKTWASPALINMIAGLKLAGIKEPEKHIAVFFTPRDYGYRYMLVAKKSPLDKEELISMLKFSDEESIGAKLQYPRLSGDFSALDVDEVKLAAWQSKQKAGRRTIDLARSVAPRLGLWSNVADPPDRNSALNDDRPYVYSSGFRTEDKHRRETLVKSLYEQILVIIGLAIGLFLILPFVIRRADRGVLVRLDWRLLVTLLGTGLGFMFLEMTGIYRFQLYLHHPTIALMTILSAMILGAGLGSIHSRHIKPEEREKKLCAWLAYSLVLASIVLFVAPSLGHDLFLALPLGLLCVLTFLGFSLLGYALGHILPLAIATYAPEEERLLAWCWAISVSASVLSTVSASILVRDYGMFFVFLLGLSCYELVLLVALGSLRRKRLLAGA